MITAEQWLDDLNGNVPASRAFTADQIALIQADALRHAAQLVSQQESVWPSFKAVREALLAESDQLVRATTRANST